MDKVPRPMVRPEDMERVDFGKVLRFGWKYLKAVKGPAGAYMFLYIFSQAVVLAATQTVAYLTNSINEPLFLETPAMWGWNESYSLLMIYGLWLVLVLMGVYVSVLLKVAAAKMDVRMANRIRAHLFSKLLGQAPEFYHENDPGRLNTTLNQLSVEAQMAMRHSVVDPVLHTITFLATGGLLFYNLQQLLRPGQSEVMIYSFLGGVAVFALLSPFLVTRLGRRVQQASQRLQEENLALAGLVSNALTSSEEIQTLQAEGFFARKYEMGLRGFLQARLSQTRAVELVNSFNALPGLIVQASLLGLAVYMVVHNAGSANVGSVVAVFMLSPQLMGPIHALAAYLVMSRSTWPSVKKITSLLECSSRVTDRPGAVDAATLEPTLSVKDLVFRYRTGQKPIFSGLSFEVPAGKITGLVGRVGQGKTTFFRLAMRLYDPELGAIYLGGKATHQITLRSLRRHTAMMSQFPAFFHDTVRENLRVAKPFATDEELVSVCRHTGLWEILVKKYGENPLEEPFAAGQAISGGQRKLFAMTRTLLRNPTFLFLDEPTVGMDSVEKFSIIPHLRLACFNKTVLAVDHDILWLMQFCDHFITLEDGKVVQQGDAPSLLAQPGLFRTLYDEVHTADQRAQKLEAALIKNKPGKIS